MAADHDHDRDYAPAGHAHEKEFFDVRAYVSEVREVLSGRASVASGRIDTLVERAGVIETRLDLLEADAAAMFRRMRKLEEALEAGALPSALVVEGQADNPTPAQLADLRALEPGKCIAPGCALKIQRQRLACKPHWYALPASLREAILAHYVVGQTMDTATPGYLYYLFSALRWYHEHDEHATS